MYVKPFHFCSTMLFNNLQCVQSCNGFFLLCQTYRDLIQKSFDHTKHFAGIKWLPFTAWTNVESPCIWSNYYFDKTCDKEASEPHKHHLIFCSLHCLSHCAARKQNIRYIWFHFSCVSFSCLLFILFLTSMWWTMWQHSVWNFPLYKYQCWSSWDLRGLSCIS